MMFRFFTFLSGALLLAGVLSAQPDCNFNFGFSVTPAACGSASAWVTIIPDSASGSAPFEYSIDGGPWRTTAYNLFIDIPPGAHTIIGRDAAGCTTAPKIMDVLNGIVQGTATGLPTTCDATTDGKVLANPSNGIQPYQYQLNGGPFQGSAAFSNVPPGNHTVIIQDVNGCKSNPIPVTVVAGPPITGSAATTATSCPGLNDGGVFITVYGNFSAGTTYSLDSKPPVPYNFFYDLSSGPHSVVIHDVSGCISPPVLFTVAQGPPVLATVNTTDPTCSGAANGSIKVTSASNGTPPFKYSLNGGSAQTDNTFNGLPAGTHTLLVTDAIGCNSGMLQVVINPGPPIIATLTKTDIDCNGAATGSISVSLSNNASPPLEYSLDNIAYQTSNIFNGLPAGTHTVYFREKNGCSGSQAITITEPPVISMALVAQPVKCNGQNNGVINITPSGGIGPYQYSLDGITYQSTNAFTVAAGVYTVYVKDSKGCLKSGIVTVAQPNILTLIATVTQNITCNGADDGIITVTANGGNPAYQYSINGGPFQAGNIFNSLAAGPYTILVNDLMGCSASAQAVINPAQPITATLNKIDVDCNGAATGSIIVSLSNNASPPFQYSLDNVIYQSANVFNGLTAGSYTIYFRDSKGCSGSQSITITEPVVLSLTLIAEPVKCNGRDNGLITASSSGGTGPYQYSLDGATYQSPNIFTVAAGTHTVYTRDSKGCLQSQTIQVTQPNLLVFTNMVTQNATCGGNDGIITVTVSGGTSPYQYSIDGRNFQQSNTFNVDPGTYTVTVKDNNACTATFPNITIILNNNLTIDAGTDTAICEGGSVQLRAVSNGTQFSWSPTTGLSGWGASAVVASPSVITEYTVTVTLGVCSAKDQVLVNVYPAPIADAGPGGDICYGQSYQLQGSGGVMYEWTPSTYLSASTLASPLTKPDQTIQYFLKVTDVKGCKSLVPSSVVVKVVPPIVVTTHPSDTIVSAGDQFQILATSMGTSYTWTPAIGLSNPNIANPIATIDSDILYKVEATTNAGCKGEAFVKIRVYKGPDLYVPTAFTPNGDGKNDKFKPFPVGIKQLNYFRIYNRWGQLVFTTKTLFDGWDGNFGGRAQPGGVYVWMVEGKTRDDKTIKKRGTVTLLR